MKCKLYLLKILNKKKIHNRKLLPILSNIVHNKSRILKMIRFTENVKRFSQNEASGIWQVLTVRAAFVEI